MNRRRGVGRYLWPLALAGLSGPAPADEAPVLRNNPFERPVFPAQPTDVQGPAVVRVPDLPPVLGGTLVSSRAPMAILDGKLLAVGGEHAGYRLVAVEEGAAVFERQGEEIRLQIGDPAKDPGKRR
jgi:hypothetical protein